MLINMVLPGAVETARLPKEYQEVEYIQSNGTQYIDTGFKPNNNTRVVMDVENTSTVTSSDNPAFFAVYDGANYFRLIKGGAAIALNWEYGEFYSLGWSMTAATFNNRRTIIANGRTATIDGVTQSYSAATFQISKNMYLLADNNNGTTKYFAYAKLYSCQIYDNGTLIRDYVPCYRKTDTSVGLYDIVNDAFYANAGTGVFTAGPNVNNTPEIGDTVEFTYSGNYTDDRVNGIGVVRLNTSGTLVVTSGTATVSVYILGGGGGAAYHVTSAGRRYGGGGGGMQTIRVTLVPGAYEIIVGLGGAGAIGSQNIFSGSNGGDTTAFSVTSTGGQAGSAGSIYDAGSPGAGGTPNGNAGNLTTGGAPNGGSAITNNAAACSGGDGYVELTFI